MSDLDLMYLDLFKVLVILNLVLFLSLVKTFREGTKPFVLR
jgi:hypothetical protein